MKLEDAKRLYAIDRNKILLRNCCEVFLKSRFESELSKYSKEELDIINEFFNEYESSLCKSIDSWDLISEFKNHLLTFDRDNKIKSIL